MDEQERSFDDRLPPRLPDGKDEMNLAEFPLCCISDRAQPDQKTLVFEDQVWDASRNEMVPRQLTITGSDRFGLPTATDDEVLVGMIQLSKLRHFAERSVFFTRYEMIRLLGWRDETKSYDRLETSLNRWVGVTLYYENAWWNREQQCWVNEKFHVLDNVTLFDREKYRRQSPSQTQLPLSHFTWNDVLFRSFKAGNLKGLDFDFFKGLDGAITKRLYRFLDKRFFHRDHYEFNLKELSWVHVGLSRNYDVANLKRRLRPAIVELEQKGFLLPMPDQERFLKVSCGDWRVVFDRARSKSLPKRVSPDLDEGKAALCQALVERGVTASTAADTVIAHPPERIRTQLEVFDWLVASADSRVSRNPAGFLISAIKSEYAPPKGFISQEERQRRSAKAADRQRNLEVRAQLRLREAEARERAKGEAIEQFWKSFSSAERERMQQEALREANALERELVERGGVLSETARKNLLDAYALKRMQHGG